MALGTTSSINSYGLVDTPVFQSGNNGQNDSMTATLASLNNLLQNRGAATANAGQATLAQGLEDFGPAKDYWSKILSGDQAEMESAIAPEKSDILSQYRARRRQMARTGSRSGGTNEATASAGYSQAGDIAGLLQKLRPQAAKATSDIASQESQFGLAESQQGNDQMLAALQSLSTERSQDIEQQGQAYQLGESFIGLF
jgi:hypothetical protein